MPFALTLQQNYGIRKTLHSCACFQTKGGLSVSLSVNPCIVMSDLLKAAKSDAAVAVALGSIVAATGVVLYKQLAIPGKVRRLGPLLVFR